MCGDKSRQKAGGGYTMPAGLRKNARLSAGVWAKNRYRLLLAKTLHLLLPFFFLLFKFLLSLLHSVTQYAV